MREDPAGQLLWEVGSNCSSSSTTTHLILKDVWLTSATTTLTQDNGGLGGGDGVGAEGGGIVGVDLDCWQVSEEGALGSLEHADKINNNIFIGDGAGALLGGGGGGDPSSSKDYRRASSSSHQSDGGQSDRHHSDSTSASKTHPTSSGSPNDSPAR